MNTWAAIRHEIDQALVDDNPIVQIRIAANALPGTIVALPVTPDRVREIVTYDEACDELQRICDGALLYPSERWLHAIATNRLLEITVHPDDYLALLREARVKVDATTGQQAIFGLPLRMELVA